MSLDFKVYRFWLLNVIFVTTILLTNCEIQQESALQEFIICRQCGADVADTYYISHFPSPDSVIYSNQSLFGRTDVKIQILVNPYGIKFQVITVTKALCTGVGEWHNAHSWYPGFAWRHCVCPQCRAHLGWMFEPLSTATPDRVKISEDGFYALIIDGILSEKLINSFLVFPGSQRI